MKKSITFTLLTFALLLTMSSAFAKSEGEQAALQGLKAVTVFIDISIFNRKKGAANKLTESHRDFSQYGYILVAVNPYIENSDLEGFFVSYQKQTNAIYEQSN